MRLGLEIPALRAADRPDGEMPLHEVARVAETSGVAALWLAEGGAGWIDPIPLAGALAEQTAAIAIGVLCRPSHGRHPSVLARDVTTIDLLSAGRAAVALLESGRAPSDLERLAEGAGLLHRLFTEHEVTAAGRFYEVAELTTRPRPMTPGGPPVVAGLEQAPVGDESLEAALIEADVDAVVVGGTASDVANARLRIDGVAPARGTPALLWRGALLSDGEAAARSSRSLRDAGADGLIALVEPAAVRGFGFVASEVERLMGTLSTVADLLR
jgi:Luciferase-like monooxygenase